jgi:hypothetical protein
VLLPAACHQVGSDGVLSIENSNTMETSVEVEEGMSIDRGYVSREMITNQVCDRLGGGGSPACLLCMRQSPKRCLSMIFYPLSCLHT